MKRLTTLKPNIKMLGAPKLKPSGRERMRGRAWMAQRARVLSANPSCAVCKHEATEVDHIIDVALGGSDEESNLQGLCHACHKVKTDEATRKRFGR